MAWEWKKSYNMHHVNQEVVSCITSNQMYTLNYVRNPTNSHTQFVKQTIEYTIYIITMELFYGGKVFILVYII